jgi:hypothetical protein
VQVRAVQVLEAEAVHEVLETRLQQAAHKGVHSTHSSFKKPVIILQWANPVQAHLPARPIY